MRTQGPGHVSRGQQPARTQARNDGGAVTMGKAQGALGVPDVPSHTPMSH